MGLFVEMAPGCRCLNVFVAIMLCLLWSSNLSYATDSDLYCLKAIKASLEDPFRYLNSSWDFNNKTEGFICRFTGIECWHPDENRVLNIKLSDMGLKGEFPSAIRNCSSLTGLDLSNNDLYGTLPEDINEILKYMTTLDLSSNNFSGSIPSSLSNCTYLNVLKLDNNRLSGQIPLTLGLLNRMKSFSVANNQLTGPVPQFAHVNFTADNYANNLGLCGYASNPCQGPSKKMHTGIIAGAAIGAVIVSALVVGLGLSFYFRNVSAKRKKEEDPQGNKWARSIKGTKGIKVSMFEKSVSKMRLSDLMKATNSFSKDNIIGSGRTGTMYKAVLEDGTSLMVKRLQDSQHSEKEFMSEMAVLGRVTHSNLVPLLGFCVAKKERLLVYRNMPNGNLHDKLHPPDGVDRTLEWPLRLKIAIGAARGFAWLHHSCNPRILHRNISSKCILLDADFEPKISDFGLARLMNPIDTHLSTFVNGEFGDLGYVAPEYARTLVATPKGDVYSFGTVLLELVTGERPIHVARAPEDFKGNLVEWITQLSSDNKLHDAIDESLVGKGFDSEVFQFLKIACNCVLPEHKERPSMFELFQFLRVIGQQYNFTVNDDIMAPSDTGDENNMDELIVAREEDSKY